MWTFKLSINTGKGAPGLECRMYTRLVSPAIGREKIKWNPLFFDKIRYLEFN